MDKVGKKVLTLDELSIILIDKRTVRPEKEVLPHENFTD